MEQDYRRAIRYALEEKRLWAAGLIAALAFSEAWWLVFDWGPESLGERWERSVGAVLGDAAALIAFVAAALAAFLAIKAVGYLGEMVLVRQVADGERGNVPRFDGAFSASRHGYLPFAVTLLPWDALRIALIYLPSLMIALWDRWDPDLDHIFLYLLALLLWFCLLVAASVFAGITATLAARCSLLWERGIPGAWREGWRLFRADSSRCVVAWLQVLAVDIAFVAIAWPLSALLPWAAGQLVDPIGFAPLRWLIRAAVWLILAGGLVIIQTGTQCFRSSLWTITYLELREGDARDEATVSPRAADGEEGEAFRPPLTDLPGPPPGLLPPP